MLSIITICFNNVEGLKKTLASVASQTSPEFEHVIVDGGSSDGSADIIREYAESASYPVRWVSEPDKGIYNAINKGMRMSSGDYIQVLNSGDIYASNDVVARMSAHLSSLNSQRSANKNGAPDVNGQTNVRVSGGESRDLEHFNDFQNQSACKSVECEFLYGNMIRRRPDGTVDGKSGEVEYSLRQYYQSTMNHDCCWIHRSLFEKYGYYDESLKIVSDWKWFLQAIGLGDVKPQYVDIDVTIFDLTGISERNLKLRNEERRRVLEELVPPAVLADYDKHAFDMTQMDKLREHKWAYKIAWTLERILNRIDNKNFRKPKQ